MKDRKSLGRFAAATAAAAFLALLWAADSQAGIFRDVLAKVGLAKQEPAPNATVGAHTLPFKGYACCNLHYEKDWINDGNYAELPMIPAGTPIEVLSYGRHRAFVKIDGKPMRLGHDYGRDQESLENWVAKIVVDQDPRARIDAYPPSVREAIRQGKVALGMTREQAIVAVGYPLTSENASLDAASWRIWRSTHGEYDLNFKSDGRLESVSGEQEVTSLVLYRPAK
ncbi:MAG TPA: hypothetical protein VEY89_09340 [Candidatus Dormibacteraeota bacterium]|nr:hypothetical protein [Candidatus Dormibacteraeota bacterium]